MPIYCYTVCWRDEFCKPFQWKYKEFPKKEDAQIFARAMKHKNKKIKPKPYILQTIRMAGYFKSQKEELVYNCKCKFYEYQKIIKY